MSNNKAYFSKDPRTLYCLNHSVGLHPAQSKIIEETLKFPLGGMMGSTDIMQLCSNLLKFMKATKVLDVGIFTGLSTLTWALALPDDGQVISMDVSDEAYNKIGKKFVEEAGVEKKIFLKIQPALITLDDLISSGQTGTFDFAFIDADKDNYNEYYEKCLILLRPGGFIAVDNALWRGSVYGHVKEPNTLIIHDLNEKIKSDSRVNCILLPIGDGLNLVFKI